MQGLALSREVRSLCLEIACPYAGQEKGYFASDEAGRVTAMQHMEHLCEALPADRCVGGTESNFHWLLATCDAFYRLQDLHMRLARLSMQEGREAFNEEVLQLLRREREEEQERIQTARAKGETGQAALASPTQYLVPVQPRVNPALPKKNSGVWKRPSCSSRPLHCILRVQ